MRIALLRHGACALGAIFFACLPILGAYAAPAREVPFSGRCYAPSEASAEQILRLHSELMVVALTCRQSSDGRDLTKAYTNFTRHNLAILRDAETTLAHHYAITYGGESITRLDRLRTLLANEFAQAIVSASAPRFCAEKRDMAAWLCDAPPQTVREEAAHRRAPMYEPICTPSPLADSQQAPQG